MSDKYQELRDALAVEPTPGPWSFRGTLGPISAPHLKGPYVVERPNGVSLAHMTGWRDDQQQADAAYIAAANPATIAALLAERDELAKDAARYRTLKRIARVGFAAAPSWDMVLRIPLASAEITTIDGTIDVAMEDKP